MDKLEAVIARLEVLADQHKLPPSSTTVAQGPADVRLENATVRLELLAALMRLEAIANAHGIPSSEIRSSNQGSSDFVHKLPDLLLALETIASKFDGVPPGEPIHLSAPSSTSQSSSSAAVPKPAETKPAQPTVAEPKPAPAPAAAPATTTTTTPAKPVEEKKPSPVATTKTAPATTTPAPAAKPTTSTTPTPAQPKVEEKKPVPATTTTTTAPATTAPATGAAKPMSKIQERTAMLQSGGGASSTATPSSSQPAAAATPAAKPKAPFDPTKCGVCQKTVYAMEKVTADNKIFHKACFVCTQCHSSLKVGGYISLQGKVYCKPHFSRIHATKGNTAEGKKWEVREENGKKIVRKGDGIPTFEGLSVEKVDDALHFFSKVDKQFRGYLTRDEFFKVIAEIMAKEGHKMSIDDVKKVANMQFEGKGPNDHVEDDEFLFALSQMLLQ